MSFFAKKPLLIEAMLFEGTAESLREVAAFFPATHIVLRQDDDGWHISSIPSQNGLTTAAPGQYIIKGNDGTFSVCDGEFFRATYEPYLLRH